MPPSLKTTSPDLYIEFAAGRNQSFTPGNAIVGQVMRRTFLQRGIVKIEVTLRGRAKTKISIRKSTGNSSHTDHYRSRCDFFTDGSQEVSQVVYHGPVDISPDTNEPGVWPFALTLPRFTRMRPPLQLEQYTLIPASREDIATHTLPDTFFSSGGSSMSSTHSESYVEYYVEARMYMTGEEQLLAVHPIRVKNAADPEPIRDFRLCRSPQTSSVQTYELQPKIEELTFSQKRRQLFHSSKVPSYAFKVWVTRPTVIQIASKTPLPLYIKAAPIPDRVSDAIKVIPQTLTLKNLVLKVKSFSHAVAPGTFHHKSNVEENQYEAHIGPEILNKLENPIKLDLEPEGESEAVNIGAILQMQLYADGLYICDKRQSIIIHRLAPTFKTYNIDLTYKIKWKFLFEMAGKEVEMRIEDKVTIIPHATPMEELPPYQPPPYQA